MYLILSLLLAINFTLINFIVIVLLYYYIQIF